MQKLLIPSTEEMNRLFIKAGENHQDGLLDEAGSGYLRLLEYFPEAPLLHFNLGLVYYEQGEYESGRDAFARAADLSPEDMDILFNLGLTQKKTGDVDGAISSYKQIIRADPKSIDARYNLASCYKDSGQNEKAIDTYLEVLQIDPAHLPATGNLAFVYHLSGQRSQAIRYYQRVLELNPDHQSAKHMLASLSGNGTASPPESYVKDVFDNYSHHYERSLVIELEYCVPTTMRELVDKNAGWKKRYAYGLDLGCGTGLAGQAFYDMVEVFDGIDISEKMIAIAAGKKIYRHLHSGNIINFLGSTRERYDFYLAADVFAYVGELATTFSLLKQKARPDVLFCFSTETLNGSGYRLQQTGRFAHDPDYIKEMAGATGWKVAASHTTLLRKEKGNWVAGDIWLLCLP